MNIDLKNLTIKQGFSILGIDGHSSASINRVGDINADGIDDIVIGAPGVSPIGCIAAGVAYGTYDKKAEYKVNVIDVNRPDNANSFSIRGERDALKPGFYGDYAGLSVNYAGRYK